MSGIFDIGNIVSILGGIISLAFTYGALNERIRNQQKQIDKLTEDLEKQTDINSRIYSMEAKLDLLLNELRHPKNYA